MSVLNFQWFVIFALTVLIFFYSYSNLCGHRVGTVQAPGKGFFKIKKIHKIMFLYEAFHGQFTTCSNIWVRVNLIFKHDGLKDKTWSYINWRVPLYDYTMLHLIPFCIILYLSLQSLHTNYVLKRATANRKTDGGK